MTVVMTVEDIKLLQRVAKAIEPMSQRILRTPWDDCDAHLYAALMSGLATADWVLLVLEDGVTEVEL